MFPRGNFLLVPGHGLLKAEVFELDAGSGRYIAESFVVVPYSEPRLHEPRPVFYKILSKETISGLPHDVAQQVLEVTAQTTREEYLRNVAKLKSHIQRGDIYEINYCIKFSALSDINPLAVFLKLCERSEAPYQFMARLDNQYILCASPELFLRKKGSSLLTKPIKGTIKRGETPNEDGLLREQLYHSIKDRTENVMAVDVARNDLSMLASRGSVKVNQLYNIESFKTVHQMVSTVSCDLQPGVDFDKIIEATFPMASMTGAPKHRAMQLIGETEKFERGYYSGTMGIIEKNGDFELPVLIRSLFYDNLSKELWFATGGAITHLSDPEAEYEECLLKARTLLSALNATLL